MPPRTPHISAPRPGEQRYAPRLSALRCAGQLADGRVVGRDPNRCGQCAGEAAPGSAQAAQRA